MPHTHGWLKKGGARVSGWWQVGGKVRGEKGDWQHNNRQIGVSL